MMSSPELAAAILQKLLSTGVRDFVICPGGRNAPLVDPLEGAARLGHCRMWTHFEERSAAFFALGLARRVSKPVVVLTTSGTAAAELLPAAIESHYQKIPLIFLTADRPKRYRPFAPPQTIDQIGLFGKYVSACLDVDAEEDISALAWTPDRSVQLNVCFDEPLVDPGMDLSSAFFPQPESGRPEPIVVKNKLSLQSIAHFREVGFIISGLSENERTAWGRLLESARCPQFFESTSGLTNVHHISEQTFIHGIENGLIQSIVRIGSTPTCRLWRDLENRFQNVPLASITSSDYRGSARSNHEFFYVKESAIDFDEIGFTNSFENELRSKENVLQFKFEKLVRQFPRAEQSFFRALGKWAANDPLYLGNSLPIRRFDQFGARGERRDVFANRGANGIDGQLASYLGWSIGLPKSWCILGDLTLLYDLAAFWSIPSLPAASRNLVLINNHGGKIFEPMFRNPLFLNAHRLEFSKLAEFWGVESHVFFSSDEFQPVDVEAMGFRLLEVRPDEDETKAFRAGLDEK